VKASGWLIAAIVACGGCPRPVPAHLRIDPAPQAADEVVISDLPSALRAMVGRDPLARSPDLPEPTALEALEGGAPLAAYVRQVAALEHGEGTVERVLQQVEDQWRETAAVPLARGYRLRLAENHLSNPALDAEAKEHQVVGLITPLSTAAQDPTLPRRPLEWLGGAEQIRSYAERWVLTSWLAGPDIPLEVLREPLSAPQFDHLRSSPIGQLVEARATGATSGGGSGLEDLRRATVYALTRAAADRDAEQARWAEQQKGAVDELGDSDPIGALLERASEALTADASVDRSGGGALLALAALRWGDRCPVAPCAGVDRAESMQFAGRWDPEIEALAALWQVVALKETLDSLEIAQQTPLFPSVMLDLADVLLGTGAGPLESALLRKQRPDAQVWLAVSRAVGAEGVTDWEGARVALGEHLQREVDRAAGLTTDPTTTEILQRIRARAVP
jgi:hypothetical protein